MDGTPEPTKHEPPEERWRATRFGSSARESYELASAVEWDDTGEGLCYLYPADASDSELKEQWLVVPAFLLLDLEDVC